jgi:integrase
MDGSSGTSPRAYPSPALWRRPSASSLMIKCRRWPRPVRRTTRSSESWPTPACAWGELVALTACRIDLSRRRIEVVEAITEVHGRVVVGTTKTHQRRSVPIPRFLADELADHLAGKAPGDLVFTAPEAGRCATRTSGRGSSIRLRRKVGLLGLTPHELRHTAASLAIAAGANVKAVQLMLGHASAAMTLDIYAGLFADDLDAVADRLDRAFVKLIADQMRTKRRTSRSDQTELPFEKGPRTGHWLGKTFSEPPRGIEPRTYALRDSPVVDGSRWLPLADAVNALRGHW